MTIEQFLSFWSQHNTAIIEGLVGLIIFISLFLGFRAFFGKSDSYDAGSGHGVDSVQLEKTLQKILDNQGAGGGKVHAAHDEHAVHAELDEDETAPRSAAAPAAGGNAESAAEVAQLRSSVNESQKKIEELQTQLAQAQAAASEAGTAAASASGEAAGGGSNAEAEAKIRDLESRLAEYEIISEDIADLSRYKEENDKLRAELEALQKGGAAPAPAAVAAEPVTAPVEEAPAPIAAAEPEPTPAPEAPAPAADDVVAAAAAMAPEQPAADGGADLIDDELMKEFAAAVEGQKALDKVGEKAGDGKAAADKKGEDTDQLMNEFENFVSKKS